MPESYRIGIDARLNAYREGGIAEYTRRLIEHVPVLDPANQYTIIHHISATQALGHAHNLRRVKALTPPHHRLERVAFGVEAARWGLQVLHSPDFIPPRWGPPWLGVRRTVITVHDLNFLHYPQFQTPESLRYYAGHIRDAVRQADHILADSQATKDDLSVLLNVPPDKVTVHLLGVSTAFRPLLPDQVQAVRERLGLASTYILFVGTFEPRKNLTGLLDAYVQLRARLPDAPPLVIAGRRGWLYKDVFDKVEELGLAAAVKWLEEVSADDLPAVYNGAAVLVLPSFYEGFGFPPLEAMACGVPTVVAKRGSLPEVVGDTGLLVDPVQPEDIAAGLARALTDSHFRQRSAAAGLARARLFTWQRTADIALSVYHKVLSL